MNEYSFMLFIVDRITRHRACDDVDHMSATDQFLALGQRLPLSAAGERVEEADDITNPHRVCRGVRHGGRAVPHRSLILSSRPQDSGSWTFFRLWKWG